MKRFAAPLFLLGLLLPVQEAPAQRVSAFQVGSYLPGVINVRDWAQPPAGFFILDYNIGVFTGKFVDRNGDEVDRLEIDLSPIDPELGTVPVDVDVGGNGYANLPALVWASKFKLLGARYLAVANLVFASANYQYNLTVPDTEIGVGAEGSLGGFGDAAFTPFGLSWDFDRKVDLAFLYTFYAPTGRYETGADDNIGAGLWTHQFQLPFYAYALNQATAFTIIPTLELSSTVKDSDFRPGPRFTLEYGISQYFTDWLELQILNGHNWQVGEDSGEDEWWDGSILDTKDRKSVFSAGLGLWPWRDRLYIGLKYNFDYGVRQRFKSEYFLVNLMFITNLLAE